MSKQTRRADGKRETIADTRFFDLREAGYTGPIDFRTGHPVEVTADSYWAHRPAHVVSVWQLLRVPVLSVVAVLVLAVAYVVALRADAMVLCALLWIPIALAAGTFVVSAIRTRRKL